MLISFIQTINVNLSVCIILLAGNVLYLLMRTDMDALFTRISFNPDFLKNTWIILFISFLFLAVYQLLICQYSVYDDLVCSLLATTFLWFFIVAIYRWYELLY